VTNDRLYFRQLLAGRDIASGDLLARQMVNFVYLIGDRTSGDAVAVDPAYAPDEIIGLLEADGMRLTGVLATHYHSDHVGGDLFGHEIAGIAGLLEHVDVPVHVQQDEAPWIERTTGVGPTSLVVHAGNDLLEVGGLGIHLLHTPGHTPGSQCLLVEGRLVTGDTLFLEGCGRTDLPGGDPDSMYDSLINCVAKLPDDTIVYPGHRYSPEPDAPLGETKLRNPVLAPRGAEEWLTLFGS